MNRKPGTYTVTANDGIARICFEGGIWGWEFEKFQLLIQALLDQGLTDAVVFIDSNGGDARAAQRIGNEIARFSGNITCRIGVLAASNATYIAAKCSHVIMAANGQYMFHKPSYGPWGNEDQIAADLKMLRNLTKDFRKVYATRSGKTEAEIEEMWKVDYWMDAEEALAQGFIDEIGDEVVTENQIVIAELKSAGRWHEPVVTAEAESLQPKPLPNKDVDKFSHIKAALGLPEDSSEAEVLKAVTAQGKTLKELEEKVDTLNTEAETRKKETVTALVDGAIKENKITEADRERYTKLGSLDYSATAEVLASLKPHVSASSRIGLPGTGPEAKFQDWDWDKFQKENPTALERMKTEDPERFAELRKEYLGKGK